MPVSPVDVPFTFQSYEGSVPSNVAAEVTVIKSPKQIVVPEDEAIERVGVPNGNTDIAMPLLVAVVGLGHTSFDVMSHVTTSPFSSELVAYVSLLVPKLLPLTFH